MPIYIQDVPYKDVIISYKYFLCYLCLVYVGMHNLGVICAKADK